MAIIPGSSPTLPSGSKPYGTQQYQALDGSIWIGTSLFGFFEVGKDLDIDSVRTTANSALAIGQVAQEDIDALELQLSALSTTVAGKANQGALDAEIARATGVEANKVDKVSGKGLSTEDFTSAEKAKLGQQSGINTGDQDLTPLSNAISAETSRATTRENQIDEKVDDSIEIWSPAIFPDAGGQSVFVVPGAAGYEATEVNRSGDTTYTNPNGASASDANKDFGYDISTGTITLPEAIMPPEFIKVKLRRLTDPERIPTTIATQEELDSLSSEIRTTNNIAYTAPVPFRNYSSNTVFATDSSSVIQTDEGLSTTFGRNAESAGNVVYFNLNKVISESRGLFTTTVNPLSVVSASHTPTFGFGCVKTDGTTLAFIYRMSDGALYKVKPFSVTSIATYTPGTLTDTYKMELTLGLVQNLKLYINNILVLSYDLNENLSGQLYWAQRTAFTARVTKPVYYNYNFTLPSELNTVQSQVTALQEAQPFRNYDFKNTNPNDITKSSTGTISIDENGLKIITGLGSTVVGVYGNTGVDINHTQMIIMSRSVVSALGTNAIIGMAFGVFSTNYLGIGYRLDGQLTSNINGTFTALRGADSETSYAVGDIIGLKVVIDKSKSLVKIQTIKNNVINPIEYSVSFSDFSNFYIYNRGSSTSSHIININYDAIPVDYSPVTVYVSKTGNDANNGSSESSAVLTLQRAFSLCVGKGGKIIGSGVYREVLPLNILSNENIEICKKGTDVFQIRGSNEILGWVKTAGQTNVYEVPFSGSIEVFTRGVNGSSSPLLFEMGNPSKPIYTEERHSLQKGLTHHLPFTVLYPVSSVLLCDSTQASFFYDTSNNKLYLHSGNSSNPITNGFSYENITREGVSIITYDGAKKANITLSGVQFAFVKSVRFNNFNSITRYFCSVLAASGDGGFRDDVPNVLAYRDECCFVNGDGINGHMNAISGFSTLDQREGLSNGVYFDPWCHWNLDDGLSFHERAIATVYGGLFEYNGDGGIRQSNDANITLYNPESRFNGLDTSVGTNGAGFDTVNSSSENRTIGCLTIHDGISYGNRKGIATNTGGAVINAFNCITRNNSESEFEAQSGVINAHNCKATNADAAKIKKQIGGIINVLNDNQLT